MSTGQTDDGSFEIASALYGSNQGLFAFFSRGRYDDLGRVLRLGRATPLYEGALGRRWGCASFGHGVLSGAFRTSESDMGRVLESGGCDFPRKAWTMSQSPDVKLKSGVPSGLFCIF